MVTKAYVRIKQRDLDTIYTSKYYYHESPKIGIYFTTDQTTWNWKCIVFIKKSKGAQNLMCGLHRYGASLLLLKFNLKLRDWYVLKMHSPKTFL